MPARLPVLVVLTVLLVSRGPCEAQTAYSGASASEARPDTANSAAASALPMALQARSTNTFGVWGAGSFVTGGPIGNIPKARLGLIGLRYERHLLPKSLHSTDGPFLTFAADLLPVLLLSIPPETISAPPPSRSGSLRENGLDTYGVGINPAGFRLTYRVAKRVQPFFEGSTGLRYFGTSVPTAWGRPLNFTFDVGAGIQVILTSNLVLTAGYRYHHLSNGFRGQINPGVDANLLHFGLAVP